MTYELNTYDRLGERGNIYSIPQRHVPDYVRDYELVRLVRLEVGQTYRDLDGDLWTRVE
ncbi:hypothetical protein CPT_Marzo_258 [Stenotrophomonas phage Marzo]|nr:hypothetical protein CPT_Marzo_258 [Stenotrophomonas phage Marzo]